MSRTIPELLDAIKDALDAGKDPSEPIDALYALRLKPRDVVIHIERWRAQARLAGDDAFDARARFYQPMLPRWTPDSYDTLMESAAAPAVERAVAGIADGADAMTAYRLLCDCRDCRVSSIAMVVVLERARARCEGIGPDEDVLDDRFCDALDMVTGWASALAVYGEDDEV